MKFYLLLLLAGGCCITSGCERGASKSTRQHNVPCQIINQSPELSADNPYGSLYEVTVSQIKGDKIMRHQYIEKITQGGGETDMLTVDSECDKLQISFRLLPEDSVTDKLPRMTGF